MSNGETETPTSPTTTTPTSTTSTTASETSNPAAMTKQSVSTETLVDTSHCNRCRNCSGFSSGLNEWRNTCTSCRCSRLCHDISIGSTCCGIDRIGFDSNFILNNNNVVAAAAAAASAGDGNGKSGGCHRTALAEAEGYTWIPPGLPANKIAEWFGQFPEAKIPRLASDGEKYRETQLIHQLPKQDLSLKFCQHVSTKDQSSFQDFLCARNDLALDVGHAVIVGSPIINGHHQTPKEGSDDGIVEPCAFCQKCAKPLMGGDVGVIAPRFGIKTFWHPACFTCTTCDEPLIDLTYYVHENQLFCGRHYAENLKPRCGACDELIFAGQYTKAKGKDFHSDHFTCVSCNESLTGQRYVLTDDRPCCIPCYEQNFTHTCRVCERRIGLDSKDMSYKDLHWHEDCFKCRRCKLSLVEKPFAAKNSLIFCSSCYDSEFAARCDACGETFRPGMKKMEYKTRKWHDKCFQCVVCKQQVGSRPFIIPNDTDVYCVGCFEEKFATKCTKCKKVMNNGGVTFKNEAWHRECFVCTNCQAMLAGQKFASRQDKPYCASCFGELFAKRCTACTKPITGAGGTRFISFEGRHWHSACFVCAICQVSMAGKGFITDGEEIICPDCAKTKLMGIATPPIASA